MGMIILWWLMFLTIIGAIGLLVFGVVLLIRRSESRRVELNR
jgi:hypothetical protein